MFTVMVAVTSAILFVAAMAARLLKPTAAPRLLVLAGAGLALAVLMALVGAARWHGCDARNTRATAFGYENYYPGVGHGRFYREGCPRRVLGIHDPFGRKDRVSPY